MMKKQVFISSIPGVSNRTAKRALQALTDDEKRSITQELFGVQDVSLEQAAKLLKVQVSDYNNEYLLSHLLEQVNKLYPRKRLIDTQTPARAVSSFSLLKASIINHSYM